MPKDIVREFLLGPPFVHVWVAFLRSLAATKGLAPEHASSVKTYWEGNVVKSSTVQLAAHVRHCRAKPCRKIEGKEGWIRLLSHSSQHWRQRCCCRRESGSAARPLEDLPRERSIEAPGTDAGEVERLARRLEAVSQRMADLLRREVLEPSLGSYAFLMKKGGQQVQEARTKAKGRTRGRRRRMKDDVSPPRLPSERPPTAFVRGETLEPSTARPKVRISRKSRAA